MSTNVYESVRSDIEGYTHEPNESVKAILELLAARDQKGRETYGTSLHSFNGRNAAQDALEEVADLFMYFNQMLAELDVLDPYAEHLTPEELSTFNNIATGISDVMVDIIAIKPYYDRMLDGKD